MPEPEVVEVRFKGSRRAYFLWSNGAALALGDPVVVEVERGQDLGRVSAVGSVARQKCSAGCSGCAVGEAVVPDHRILRRATAEEARRADDLRKQEEDDRRKVIDRVARHQLLMKVSDAEWQWDRRKLTVYFTAEKRVDFRALVRDLAALFRTRIELRQIGARDEAKRLDGVGRCGRQYCCSSWLPELRPVSLSLAKDQRLSLNPSQISGGCGRLLCCLRYEHEFYVASRRRFPKEGKEIRTSQGVETVLAVDIFRERVTLKGAEGSTRVAPLAQLKAEVAQAATSVPPPPAEPPDTPAPPEGAGHDAAAPAAPADPLSPEPRRPRRRRRRGSSNGGR